MCDAFILSILTLEIKLLLNTPLIIRQVMTAILIILFLQIVFESLPISSSGHLFFIKKLFFKNIQWTELLDHLAHAPTLIILLIFFKNDWLPLARRLLSIQPKRASHKKFIRLFLTIFSFVFIADCITGVFYLVLKQWGEGLFCPMIIVRLMLWVNSCMASIGLEPTSIGFIVTGGLLLSLYFLPLARGFYSYGGGARYEVLTLRKSVMLGVVQGLALLPGLSRFGAMYVAARWLKISPRRAFQISFLFQVPLLFAALFGAVLKISFTSAKFPFYSWSALWVVMLAMVISYLLLALARRWSDEHKFFRFGIYMILVGVLTIIF